MRGGTYPLPRAAKAPAGPVTARLTSGDDGDAPRQQIPPRCIRSYPNEWGQHRCRPHRPICQLAIRCLVTSGRDGPVRREGWAAYGCPAPSAWRFRGRSAMRCRHASIPFGFRFHAGPYGPTANIAKAMPPFVPQALNLNGHCSRSWTSVYVSDDHSRRRSCLM